jgi:hypothetical protein
MLSIEKHCEMLSAVVRDRLASISDGFKLFVQLFTALVAGVVVMRMTYAPERIPATFAWLSNGLAILITAATVLMVWDAFRSWHGYRKRLSEVAGESIIPPPKWFPSSVWIMVSVMLIACGLFCWFNPLWGP